MTPQEKAGTAQSPLPEPFQPPLTILPSSASAAPPSLSPFTVTAEALHLPSALLALHLTLTTASSSTSDSALPLLDYAALAAAAGTHVGKALGEAGLAWRQLSRLRFFYPCGGGSGSSRDLDLDSDPNSVLDEVLLREAVAGALPPEGQGVACTFVPVASLLLLPDRLEGGAGACLLPLLRVQALALDLERIRTEAWVHEVADGGI